MNKQTKNQTLTKALAHFAPSRLGIMLLLTLLLPAVSSAQSEITHRVSAAQMGYHGNVKFIQNSALCTDSAHRFFITKAEAYNSEGLRTEASTADMLYQQDEYYEYDGQGHLLNYVFKSGSRDSVVFHYDVDGCLNAFDEYFLSEDPTEGNSLTTNTVTCDDQCRVLKSISVWEDTVTFSYDTLGRLVEKKLPTKTTITYHYDKQGRLERMHTTGENNPGTDDHFRYNDQGDTLEIWHTNWEHIEGETGAHEVGEHKHFAYSRYDEHGNWQEAEVTVRISLGRPRPSAPPAYHYYKYRIIRTFSYYD